MTRWIVNVTQGRQPVSLTPGLAAVDPHPDGGDERGDHQADHDVRDR
jgi:hypothetical protein